MSIRAKPKFYLTENVILDKKRKDNQFNFNFQHDNISNKTPALQEKNFQFQPFPSRSIKYEVKMTTREREPGLRGD